MICLENKRFLLNRQCHPQFVFSFCVNEKEITTTQIYFGWEMAFMCAGRWEHLHFCRWYRSVLLDLSVAVEKSLWRFYFLFQGIFLGLAKCTRLRSIKSLLWMPTDSMSWKHMSSTPRPDVTQYWNSAALPWPVRLIQPWTNRSGRTTEMPDQLCPMPGSENRRDQTMQSKVREIHVLKYPRGDLFFFLSSWAVAWVLPWQSPHPPWRQKYQGLCVLLDVPVPSPPDADAHAFLQPHRAPHRQDTLWQGHLLFTLLNVFSGFIQCSCFPIIKLNCSL